MHVPACIHLPWGAWLHTLRLHAGIQVPQACVPAPERKPAGRLMRSRASTMKAQVACSEYAMCAASFQYAWPSAAGAQASRLLTWKVCVPRLSGQRATWLIHQGMLGQGHTLRRQGRRS